MKPKKIVLVAISLFTFLSIAAQAQSGGDFALTQTVIAGGGGTSSGGSFSLDSTTGQPVAGAASASSLTMSIGFWSPDSAGTAGTGLEADVAARPTGDGVIQSNDIVQVRRFLITADAPNPLTNEFQRADSAPYSTRGDGLIQSNDVVQARRYLITADLLQQAGGPLSPPASRSEEEQEEAAAGSEAKTEGQGKPEELAAPINQTRQLRIEDASGSAGQQVTVNIRVDAVGDESEYGFAVNYNASILTSPTTGAGNAGATSRSCFVNPPGRLNCSVGAFPTNNPSSSTDGIGEIGAGTNQILMTVTFTIASNAPAGETAVTLSNVNASNDAAQNLQISGQNGKVTVLGPTRAMAAVSGRVVSSFGRGIARARVSLTDASGEVRRAVTNQFGYYRIEGVVVGESYLMQVRHKSHQFNVQYITVLGEIDNLNFTALP